MTQNDEVLDYLKKHGTITPLEALKELGIMRLASRVSDLRKAGIPIGRRMIQVQARNGRKPHVAQYYLVNSMEEENNDGI